MADGPDGPNNAAPNAGGSSESADSTAADLFSRPVSSDSTERAQHENALRELLRSGAVAQSDEADRGRIHDADDVSIADLGNLQPAPQESTQESTPDQDQAKAQAVELQELRDELRGTAQWNTQVLQAVHQVQRQNQLLTQRLERYEAIDQQLSAEAEAERRAAEIPDFTEDPQAALRAMLHEEVGQVEARMNERQREEMERLRQDHARQQVARHVLEDLNDAYQQWPEYAVAMREWGRHAVEHYQNTENLDPATAAQYAQSYLSNLAMQAAMRGESPADKLYLFLHADRYRQEDSTPNPAAATPAQPRQAFIDRADRAQAPAAAASPPTNETALRALVLDAGRGDLQANEALLKHAAQLGDPRNDEARRLLMRQFGQPMT